MGSYNCSCQEGFTLNADGRNCDGRVVIGVERGLGRIHSLFSMQLKCPVLVMVVALISVLLSVEWNSASVLLALFCTDLMDRHVSVTF